MARLTSLSFKHLAILLHAASSFRVVRGFEPLAVTPTAFSAPFQFFSTQVTHFTFSKFEHFTTTPPPPLPPPTPQAPIDPSSSSVDPSSRSLTTALGTQPFKATAQQAPTRASVPTQSVASPPARTSVPTQTPSPSPPIASAPNSPTSATHKDAPESRSAPRTLTRSSTSPSETEPRLSAVDRHSEQVPTSTAVGVKPFSSSARNPPAFSTRTAPSQPSGSTSLSTPTRASSTHVIVIVLSVCAVLVVCILLVGVLFYLRARSRRRGLREVMGN